MNVLKMIVELLFARMVRISLGEILILIGGTCVVNWAFVRGYWKAGLILALIEVLIVLAVWLVIPAVNLVLATREMRIR